MKDLVKPAHIFWKILQEDVEREVDLQPNVQMNNCVVLISLRYFFNACLLP